MNPSFTSSLILITWYTEQKIRVGINNRQPIGFFKRKFYHLSAFENSMDGYFWIFEEPSNGVIRATFCFISVDQ